MPEQDEFVNQAYLSVTESAGSTLTFAKLETGISIYEKVGWLISRMDYNIDLTNTALAASGDALQFGLSVSNTFATPSMADMAVLDFNEGMRADYGTAANAIIHLNPRTKTFADLPGRGLLVAPNPIYLWALGVSIAGAQTVTARMFYTVKKLKPEEFWELVESRRMVGA